MTYDQQARYEERCRESATRQGLDPITHALSFAGIDYAVEQTGGFTMVVTVTVPTGTFGITHDGDGYLFVFYPGTTWQDGTPDSEAVTVYDLTVDEVVDVIRQARRESDPTEGDQS